MKTKLLFDLKKPSYSYMIGFIQTDGHLAKGKGNKGNMVIELNIRDSYILKQFQKIIPVNSHISTRKRTTKFTKSKKLYTSELAALRCSLKAFRDTINYYGVPYGKKSYIIQPPIYKYSENDYWRGIIDGDGSIGFTCENKPFISLVTNSDKLAKAYMMFINKKFDFKRSNKKNSRDGAYNIMIINEDAQKIISILYYKNCLSLPRKYKMALKILKWKRSEYCPKREIPFEKWTKKDIAFLINNSVNDCILKFKFNRSNYSIRIKRAKERRKLKEQGITIRIFRRHT